MFEIDDEMTTHIIMFEIKDEIVTCTIFLEVKDEMVTYIISLKRRMRWPHNYLTLFEIQNKIHTYKKS